MTAKLTPTTPPESRIASSCSSVRLRDAGQSAWAFECVATSGASESRATSQNPAQLRCERSTRIPSRLHAATSSRPALVSPPPTSDDDGKRNGTPSAKSFDRDHVGPIERRPRSYHDSRFERSRAIGSAPSMWTIAVTTPSRKSRAEVARPTGSAHNAANSSSAMRAASSCGIGSGSGIAYGISVGSGKRGDGT